MKKDKNLIALLIGIAIPIAIMPILNSFVEIIEGFAEIIKGHQIKSITKINIDNVQLQQKLEELQEPVASNVIGYEIPNDEYIYGDECKKDCSDNTKVGFH